MCAGPWVEPSLPRQRTSGGFHLWMRGPLLSPGVVHGYTISDVYPYSPLPAFRTPGVVFPYSRGATGEGFPYARDGFEGRIESRVEPELKRRWKLQAIREGVS